MEYSAGDSMKNKRKKIGIFDSGIGGITVLKEILSLAPDADMVYLGDCARLPYGTKSPKTIIRYSLQCAGFLVSKDIDMLVVACNTASAHAIPALREELDIPVVGVVEAGSRAAVETGAATIGVIGTSSTVASRAYENTIHSLMPAARVVARACPLFVPLVEEGWCADEITAMVARRYLKDLVSEGVETLLLGCTHYPLLKDVIQDIMGPGVLIVDSAYSTACAVRDLVGLPGSPGAEPRVSFFLTDTSPRFVEIGARFLAREMTCVYDVDI